MDERSSAEEHSSGAHDAAAYGAAIATEYDQLYAGVFDTDATVEAVADLAGPGGSVLELGIGTGRLALPLVERGHEVHGVEGSPDMVDQLRAKPGGAAIPVAIGDFAEVDLGRQFRVVLLTYNTIYALPDQDAQVRAFERAAAHLEPGGCFVVEAWVPDVGKFRRNQAVSTRHVAGDRVSIEVAWLDQTTQTMSTTQIRFRDGDVRLYPANHRYAWPAELDLMARLAGMGLEQRWASWKRDPFTPDSTDHVSVYRKP